MDCNSDNIDPHGVEYMKEMNSKCKSEFIMHQACGPMVYELLGKMQPSIMTSHFLFACLWLHVFSI